MSTLTQKLKRNAYGAAAILLTAAITIPNVLVGTVSAAQVTERSIQMSSSTPSASGQTYKVKFDLATTGQVQGIVVDFCDESPLIGGACTLPTGMTLGTTVASATVDTVADSGTWTAAIEDTSAVALQNATTGLNTSGETFEVELSGFTNPSTTGTFYARIMTYGTASHVDTYVSTNPNVGGTRVDEGGVALSTAAEINVSAAVMETLTFCVSAAAPDPDCTNTTTPSLALGHGSPLAIDSTAVDVAGAYFQLSTNASGNTIVNMRTGNVSGGLDSGANTIPAVNDPTTPQAIVAGTEEFGVRVQNGTGGTGTVTAASAYAGGAGEYNMRTAQASGTYGDTIANATGPTGSMNVPLTFAATASSTTAAGIYTADITLIATSSY